MTRDRFHGRVGGTGRICDWPNCQETGEFRAPGIKPSGFDGPGDYRWFCLEHVRAFNAGYDYFEGMSAEEIWAAQSPIAGWERETRAFRPTAGVDETPRWADYDDPLEAISRRARDFRAARAARAAPATWPDGRLIQAEEQAALTTLGLEANADRRALRVRYSDLVHRFHPDRNGGDRRHEARLQQVVEAYQLLRRLPAFA
ncbi:DnaJ domain-containing protein [Novosphingobium sp. FSY-8]|uniref:DnaJ domain-containing protein n=1 Tax=Novosphingobium ovatum TaxID=1908523 RepID=A0ABW9XAV6_9SPHN|nr:J domain-containing protein [Novosphingobium ovatum]NBC35669.1 DnaJ domain-containing protein [Novosphingobium ovatum]